MAEIPNELAAPSTLEVMAERSPRPLPIEHWNMQKVNQQTRQHHFCRLLWPQMAWYVSSNLTFREVLMIETPWLRDFNPTDFRKILPQLTTDWATVALYLRHYVNATYTDCLLQEYCSNSLTRAHIEKWAAISPKVYDDPASDLFWQVTIPLEECYAKTLYHEDALSIINTVIEFCSEARVPHILPNLSPIENLIQLEIYYARVSEYKSREIELVKEIAKLKAEAEEQTRVISIMALRGMLERLLVKPDGAKTTACWIAFWKDACKLQYSYKSNNRVHPLHALLQRPNGMHWKTLEHLGEELYGQLSNEIHQYKGVVKVDRVFNSIHCGAILKALVPPEASQADGTIDLKAADEKVDWTAHKRKFVGRDSQAARTTTVDNFAGPIQTILTPVATDMSTVQYRRIPDMTYAAQFPSLDGCGRSKGGRSR